MSYQVGDTLYYVYNDSRRGNPFTVTIEKIGRKWMTVSPSFMPRINVETLSADGGVFSSPGRCFSSKEEYDAIVARQKAWGILIGKVSRLYSCPKHISLTDIETIISILNGQEDAS